MNKSKRNYQHKCKRRTIDFYLYEKDLYEFTKTINFQKFVKDMIQLLQHDAPTSIMRRAYARKDNEYERKQEKNMQENVNKK